LAIRYFEEGVRSKLSEKRKLSAFIREIINEHLELRLWDITYIFCDDAYLLEKNVQFLNHDTLTDIITFDLSSNEDELISEIYISVERVAENAAKFGVSYRQELHRVIFHGVLHLCGFRDKKPAEKQEMRHMENLCLQKYFDH
jgi:probable rRNA maturation factor